jgi:hypothetical protein
MMTALALDQIVLTGALLLGAVTALYAALAPGETRPDEEEPNPSAVVWSDVGAGLCAVLVLFLGTLPARPPFSPGGRLGVGLLIGGVSGLLGVAVGRRLRMTEAAVALAAGGLCLVGISATMLVYRGDPAPALFGLALGQALVALFAVPRAATVRRGVGGLLPELLALLSTLLAAGVSLAIARYADAPASERLAWGHKLWWTLPVIVLAGFLFGQMAAQALARRTTGRLLVTAGAAAVVLGAVVLGYARYLELLAPVAVGFVSGGLLVAISRAPGGQGAGLLGAALTLVVLVVAYRFSAGLGVALAALGFAGTSLCWYGNGAGPKSVELRAEALPVPAAALALLTTAALFRVYYVQYGLDETSVFLTAHYTLIGLIVGSLAPMALSPPPPDAERSSRGTAPFTFPARGVVLAAALLLPALMVVFWGIRACAGLLLGTALGLAYLLWVRLLEGDRDGGVTARMARAMTVAPVLILSITCVQALSLFDDYAGLLTRAHRIAIVLVLTALLPAAVLARALIGRRAVSDGLTTPSGGAGSVETAQRAEGDQE